MASSRLQLALNVSDLDQATEFYSRLFGSAPQKVRPGYANFTIADPPLKLVLFETTDTAQPLNHLGVELVDSEHVEEAAARLDATGLGARVAEEETCCHATQNKIYVDAPDVPLGFWEFYTVLDESPDAAATADGECCTDEATREACCA